MPLLGLVLLTYTNSNRFERIDNEPWAGDGMSLSPAATNMADPFLTTTAPFAMDEDPRGDQDVLYLPPPTLSRLPFSLTSPPVEKRPFDFEHPEVVLSDSLLPSIDLASWHLHLALHKFRPAGRDYPTQDYRDAFNWTDIKLPIEVEREWYAVAFRSQRDLDEDAVDLYEADRAAHEEAISAGGLLMYWYGIPNAGGANLATCIWQSSKSARDAVSGPKHQKAMALAGRMYKTYKLERWVLRKRHGRKELEVFPWQPANGEVGYH